MTSTILVSDYMTASPHSVGVTVGLLDAKNMMKAYKIRHLPVLEGRQLVGVVSDRDVQMVEALSGTDLEEVTVEEAMSQAPYTVSANTPLQVAALHMAKHKLGSAVVMEGTKVVGVLTTTDGMRALAELLAAIPGKPASLEKSLAKASASTLAVPEKKKPARAARK